MSALAERHEASTLVPTVLGGFLILGFPTFFQVIALGGFVALYVLEQRGRDLVRVE